MPTSRRLLQTLVCLALGSELLFIFNLDTPGRWVFDETHYVPAAISLLQEARDTADSHPPLGKELIAVGINAFGDEPFGWRIMSTLFGTLIVLAMYLWGLQLFKDQKTAVWIALLGCFNNMLFIQSRLAMLDVFMTAFLLWGMVLFWGLLENPKADRRLYYFMGALMGLAVACKWIAAVPLAMQALVILRKRLLPWRHFTLAIMVVPAACYLLTFLPMILTQVDFLPGGLIRMHHAAWEFQKHVPSHPYMSRWYTWPLMLRPMSYAFDKEGLNGEFVREIFMVCNPLIAWCGLLAIAICLWDGVKHRKPAAAAIVTSYAVLYLCWAITPRAMGFFYYYFPPAMILGLALAYVFKEYLRDRGRWVFLAASMGLFIYFYPVLAGLKIPFETFVRWAWFPSWI